MKRLVVTGSFPFTTHTFVIREVASAHAGGDDILVLAPDDGDKGGNELRASLGFPSERAIYLDYSRCPPISFGLCWFRRDVKRAGNRDFYGRRLAWSRRSFFCKLIRDPRLRHLDLIHAHFTGWAFNVAAPLAEVLKVPLTIAAHDAELFSKYGRTLLAGLQQRAEVITLDSSGAFREWSQISGSSSRLRLVPQGVDLGEFEGAADRDRQLGLHAPVRLISVARLTPHKRIGDAIRAVHELTTEGIDISYSIASDGPERASLEELSAQLGLDGRVRFLSFVSRERLLTELESADLFVHPSEAEGFGVAVVEAMASGLPVVVARSLGVQDIVDHGSNGYLYEPGDVARLSLLLRSLINNAQLRLEVGRRARQSALERFSWKRRMETMNEVWAFARQSFEARRYSP